MDKLLALQAFVETVKAGGFSAAARHLNVATSTVTRLVDALEAQLGSTLLNRSTRLVTVTDAGQAYFEHAGAILDAVAEADDSIVNDGDELKGHLRVSVPVEFGRRVIAPHVARFMREHPKLHLSLTLSDAILDLVSERIDVAIRLNGLMVSDDLVCRPIGTFQRWLVASPDYLAAAPALNAPRDLQAHACLRFDFGHARQTWRFRRDGTETAVAIDGRLKINNADVLRTAAGEGAGVALLAHWLVAEDVQAGRLVRLLPAYQIELDQARSLVSALYLPNHRGSKRVNAFISFLQGLYSG